MGKVQYMPYQREFSIRVTISASTTKSLKGIEGSRMVLGEACIKIPFVALGMVINVTFSILKEDAPLLLINRDMIDSVLYISLQGCYFHVGTGRQALALRLENYFLDYR